MCCRGICLYKIIACRGVRAAGRYMVVILGRGVQDGMLGTDVFLFQHKSVDIDLWLDVRPWKYIGVYLLF